MAQIIGHHATTERAWQSIESGSYVASTNAWDWLGDGIYFWQDSPSRAAAWAERYHGDKGVVLESAIDLDGCFDLLSTRYFSILNLIADQVIAGLKASGNELPRQHGGNHGLDRVVLNYAASVLAEAGQPMRSVRAAFQEGEPAFPGSGLYSLSHVQIAVRDPAVILHTRKLGQHELTR